VEDDDVLRGRLSRAFRDRGFDVGEAADEPAALRAASDEPPEYALVDLRLGNKSGLEVVRGLVELDPSTVVIVLTGYGSIATALEAIRLGATHYLTKPADIDRGCASPRPVGDSRRGHLRQSRGSSWRTRSKWPLRASRTSSVIHRVEASIVVRKWRPPQTRAFAVSSMMSAREA